MANTKCTCGAPMANHPGPDSQYAYPCLEALRASNVRVQCAWPGCAKKSRKVGLGDTFCAEHRKAEWSGFMFICHHEGPSGLCRPLPTIEERKHAYETGTLPPSRLTPITFENTRMQCAECEGPLVMLNDADWSPELPNAMSCRDQSTPWGIGICRKCSFNQAVA